MSDVAVAVLHAPEMEAPVQQDALHGQHAVGNNVVLMADRR